MKTIIGVLIAIVAFWVGFASAAGGHGGGLNFGAAGALVHFDNLVMILGMLIGGLIISFELNDLRMMMIACFFNSHQVKNDKKIRTHVLICQSAAKLSILAGMISSISGIIVVMMYKIGGDTVVVGQGIATALCGAMAGVILAGLFTALKYRFLRQIETSE